jgi:hypothetical protein
MNMPSQTDVQVQRIRAIGLTVTNCVDAKRLVARHHSLDFYTQVLLFEFVSDITVAGQDYTNL